MYRVEVSPYHVYGSMYRVEVSPYRFYLPVYRVQLPLSDAKP